MMSKLSKNIIYNLFGQGLLLILGFVAVKYVFSRLGEDALGIIYFTLMMNSILCAVLEMGICSTTTREVAAYFKDDPEHIHNLIRTASLLYWGTYVLLAASIYLAAPVLVERWINLKTLDAATATYVLRIMGIAAALTLPQRFYASLFRGLQRMEFNNVIDVAIMGLQQFGMILILVLGGDLFYVVYWFAVCFGFSILMYLFASAHFFSWRILIPGYSSAVIKRTFWFSLNMMSISILAMIHTQADKVIVSKLLPLGIFGYYGVAYGAVSRGTLVTGAISQAAFPSLSVQFKTGDRVGFMSQYRKLQDLFCFATVPMFGAIPFAAVPLFTYLFNAEAARMLLLPTTFLCVGYYMSATVNAPYFVSLAMGKSEITARSTFYALFVVLPVTIALVYFFGLTGAGLSWVFYHMFYYAYGVPRICSECLEITVSGWYRHVLKIHVLVGLTYGFAWAFLGFLGANSIHALVLAYLGATVMFMLGAYWLMGEELKTALWRLLQTLRIRSAEVSPK